MPEKRSEITETDLVRRTERQEIAGMTHKEPQLYRYEMVWTRGLIQNTWNDRVGGQLGVREYGALLAYIQKIR